MGLGFTEKKNFLFSIAIDSYQHLPKLHNAVRGSKALIEVLLEKYQFDEENVVTLYDEEATRHNIFKEFRHLREKVTQDDNLIVLYSGHGEIDKEMGFWIPVDAKGSQYFDEYISTYDIKYLLNSIEHYHSVLVIDTIFSGVLLSQSWSGLPFYSGSRWLITAGRKDDQISDGLPGQYSPLFSGLIQTLKERMTDINVRSLSIRVSDRVREETNDQQSPDFGSLNGIGTSKEHFTFKLRSEFRTHDVFISYAREDKDKVKSLATELKKSNFTVWWDEDIPPGEKFDEFIKKNIDLSKIVIVAWSESSIDSDWVKEEANLGKESKKLIPILIEDVDPPFGFGYIQATNLVDWEPGTSHNGFEKLLKRINQKVKNI